MLFVGLCEKFWPTPRIKLEEPIFGPAQPPEYRGIFGEVGAFDKWGTTEIYHFRLIDIMEIARSEYPFELVWQEL